MRTLLPLLALAGVAPAQGLDVAVEGVEVAEVVRLVERYAGVRAEVDESVARRKITLQLARARAETALRCAAFAAEAVARRGPDGIWHVEEISKRSWLRDALETLRKKRLDAGEPRETPLADLLARLRGATGLNVVLDPRAGLRESAVVLSSERSAFEHLVALSAGDGPAWDLRWETLFVSTEARLAELRLSAEAAPEAEPGPKEKESARRLEERRLDLPEEASPLSALLDLIARAIEREIAVDPRAMLAVGQLDLAAPARSIAARSALDLLCTTSGLAYALRGDGVIIRTP